MRIAVLTLAGALLLSVGVGCAKRNPGGLSDAEYYSLEPGERARLKIEQDKASARGRT